MKLTERSDAELSRWIANNIEPLEALNKRRPRPNFLGNSDLGCWQGDPRHEWQPFDMVNDPDMTVMLLKLPAFVSLTFIGEDNVYDVTFCGETIHTVDCGVKMKTAVHAHLGRAIAMAYALAHGFTEE